jgi:hypothetical protein
VRFLVTMLLWLVTTVALAAAVPGAWLQRNVIDVNGYATLAQSAARDPALQSAMAAELTTQVVALAANRGDHVSEDLVRGVATAYTASASFPGQFARANRIAHEWLFTNSARQSAQGGEVDLAPMLADATFAQTLNNFNIAVPTRVTVPVSVSGGLRPGELRASATWGPWVSLGAAVLAGVAALMTLASARARGKALAALGVSALLVGAGGWAAVEIGRRYIDTALNHTTGDVRQIADVMVAHAENSLHQWFNLTLAGGGASVVFGILVTMLGGLRHKS